MDHHAKPMTQSSTEFQGLFGQTSAPKEQNTTGRMDHHAKPTLAPGYQTQGCTLTGVMDLSTRVEYLNSLLEQGAIDEQEYVKRAEPLEVAQTIIQACTTGDIRTLEKTLNDNPYMNVDLIAEKESTPVSVAVSSIIAGRGTSAMLKVLLSRGGQANRRTNGMTPLLSICKKPNLPDVVNCARVLLENRGDATATTIVTGKTEPISCISYAVEARASPDLIKILLENGASPNDLLAPHGPLLVNCIIEEYPEIARVLLEFGADPNCRQTGLGASALAISITNKYVQMVELLLQRGADRDAPIMRDQKTSARQLVAELVKKDPGTYQRIERMF
jgi:ankyrin repeat protein